MSETEMLWKLRQLPRELEPGRDLWPGIAAAIDRPRASTRARWLAPFALAASVLLAAGIAWRAQHDAGAVAVPALAARSTTSPAPVPVAPATAARDARDAQRAGVGDAGLSRALTGTVVVRESKAVVREYQAALRQFDGAPVPAEVAPALLDLDRSVLQIRRAIAADPGSAFLLEQLRRTYELRLSLTQRAALG